MWQMSTCCHLLEAGGVHQDVRDQVRSMRRFVGVHTTWQKCGPQGKAAWCEYLGAEAIFDDDAKICCECFGKGIQTFALMSCPEVFREKNAAHLWPNDARLPYKRDGCQRQLP